MSASIRVGVEYGVMRGAQVVRVVHVVSQKENGDFLSEPRGTWSPSGRARSGSGAHLVEITSDVRDRLRLQDARQRLRREKWTRPTDAQIEIIGRAMGWWS